MPMLFANSSGDQGVSALLRSTHNPSSLASPQELSHSAKCFQNPLPCPEVPLLLTLYTDDKQVIWANNKQQVHSQCHTSQNRSGAGIAVSMCNLHHQRVALRPEACTWAPCLGSSTTPWFWQRENYSYSLDDGFLYGFVCFWSGSA